MLERRVHPEHRADLGKMVKTGSKETQESLAPLEYQGNQD